MAIFKTFSRRCKEALRGATPEVYRYDDIPQHLRVQIAHVCRDALGEVSTYGDPGPAQKWQTIFDIVTRERGLFNIGDDHSFVDVRCLNYFLQLQEFDHVIDFIEIVCKVIVAYNLTESDVRYSSQTYKASASDAIAEINTRMRQEAVGYAFEVNEIIRVDNFVAHEQVVKPALLLLSSNIFAKANEDYLQAHEHYRHNRHKDCVVAAQRAFESAMKAVCTAKKWQFKSSDRATELIKTLRANELFPSYLDAGFDTFISALKTGLPGVRNNAGGHGSEPSSMPVPPYISSYALHLTAANIILIGEALKYS